MLCQRPHPLLRPCPITIPPSCDQPTAMTCHDDLYRYLDPYQDPIPPNNDIYRDAHSDNPSDTYSSIRQYLYQATTNYSFTPAIPQLFVYYFLPFQVGMSGCFHVFPIATLSSTAAMHPCAHYLARPFAPCHDWIDASFG